MDQEGLGLKRPREEKEGDQQGVVRDEKKKMKKKKLKKEIKKKHKKKKKHKMVKKDKEGKKKPQRRLDSSDDAEGSRTDKSGNSSKYEPESSDESTTGDDQSTKTGRRSTGTASGSISAASWYETILREEKGKPKIGTVHATNEGKKYIKNYTTGEAMDAGVIEENMERSKLWWKCTKCGKENYKKTSQCEFCNAMKRLG